MALLLVLFILILPDPPLFDLVVIKVCLCGLHAVCRLMANYICAALIYIGTKAGCPSAGRQFHNTNDRKPKTGWTHSWYETVSDS